MVGLGVRRNTQWLAVWGVLASIVITTGCLPMIPAFVPRTVTSTEEALRAQDSIVFRTDFTSDGWQEVVQQIGSPSPEGFYAYVQFVDDPALDQASIEQLLATLEGSDRSFFFVVDSDTITSTEHPVLVVDAYHEPGRTFRVIPSEMSSVENNLSIANMDWEDFADSVDTDGVFRGFR